MNEARIICLKWIQETSFSRDISRLKIKKPVGTGSSLSKLNPFLDDNGILRVGCRLQNSDLSFNAQHPVILPKTHIITTLLVQDAHRTYLHPGPSLLTAIIRQRFWIPGSRNLCRKIYRECIVCLKQKAPATTQLMGSLPRSRVLASRPFSQTGIDYGGPIVLSSRTGKNSKLTKGYIALFVRFATKALHLELVSSLTSEAFVAALRRFISRRGVPKDIYSDNGTNFVGARKCLNELHKLALSCYSDTLISSFLSQQSINWHFIPPGAPHFGGLWEAGVRSVKWHLRRVIGETRLGFEEMSTLLCQVEAVLNSRPLCSIASDLDEGNFLTPGHFLIGTAPTTLPEEELYLEKISYSRRWQLLQAMLQGFWRRWRTDYLYSLQERRKWTQVETSLKEGDIVLLRETNVPPSIWPLGRVVEVFPGEDKLVRVVSIQTSKGIFKRAINKVIRLPVS